MNSSLLLASTKTNTTQTPYPKLKALAEDFESNFLEFCFFILLQILHLPTYIKFICNFIL